MYSVVKKVTYDNVWSTWWGRGGWKYEVVLMLTNILQWREIDRCLLLHLCSLLRFKTFLKINTWEGAFVCVSRWGEYRWDCWTIGYRLSSPFGTVSVTRACTLIRTWNFKIPNAVFNCYCTMSENGSIMRGINTKWRVSLAIDSVLFPENLLLTQGCVL
jgi:hypothetical protein